MVVKTIQREIEASVGKPIIKMTAQKSLKKSKLVQKKVYLPNFGIHMSYLERVAKTTTSMADSTIPKNSNCTPTLLFCHGLSGSAEDLTQFITSLNIHPQIRILVPDQIGHGKDLLRVKNDPENFHYPTHASLLESTSEFLDVVNVGSNCNAFGISLGGALVYYLRLKRPDIIQRTVLVSPAITHCLDNVFITDVLEGRNKFIAFESREDLKLLLRDLSTGRNHTSERKKKDPIPRFFLESLYRMRREEAPEGYHKEMLHSFLKNLGMTHSGCLDDSIYAAETDIDKESPRLVIWPEKDAICNCETAKEFFMESKPAPEDGTIFETIPDCGHGFHSDGRFIFNVIATEPRVKEYLLDFSSFHSCSDTNSTSSLDSDQEQNWKINSISNWHFCDYIK